MANSNSNSVEERWVEEKNKIFSRELKLNIDHFDCPSVFRVPRALADTKPEAYTPQIIGLGPFHHQRLDLYTMQREKLDDVVNFLDRLHKMDDFKAKVHTLEQKNEYQIRASYHDNLDFSPQALAWIIAIDSVYLFNLLLKNDESISPELVAGVLMLENQIPFTLVIGTLDNILDLHKINELVFRFCEKVSPMKLNKMQIMVAVLKKKGHLLSMMYHSILDMHAVTEIDDSSSQRWLDSNAEESISINPGPTTSGSRPPAIDRKASSQGVAVAGIESQIEGALNLFDKIWRNMTGLFKSVDPDYEANRGVEEIRIPSVSQLRKNAGIKVVPLPARGGITAIKFEEREKKLYLPRLTLRSNSEVILRNLCAYEEARYKYGLMGEYVDLMCGIVDTAEDIRTLRQQPAVITTELEDTDIVGIFIGRRKMAVDNEGKTKSNVAVTIEAINKVYDQSRKVRCLRMMWKVVGKLRILIICLLILGVVASLLLSTVCQFHDCQKL